MSRNPFVFPLDDEVEKMLEDLPEGLYKPIWKLINHHRTERPKGFGLNLQYLDPEFSTVEGANRYLGEVMQHLSFHRQQACMLDIARTFLIGDNRKFRKKSESLEKENTELKEQVARLKLTIAELVGAKKKKSAKESPDSLNEEPQQKENKKRGAPKGHAGATRQIMDDVFTKEENVYPEVCSCGSHCLEISEKYEDVFYEDIQITMNRTKKRFYRGICTTCGKEVRHPDAAGTPVRIGPNAAVIFTLMRQNLGASYRNIADFSTRSLQLPITPAGLHGIIDKVSQKALPAYLVLQEQLRSQDVIHGDETGWKMDGDRWYLWTFCNDNIAYFHAADSRGRGVINKVLGSDYSGLVHADFYAAYNHLPNTQRCLIHLDRDIKKELQVKPDDKALNKMHSLIWDLVEIGENLQKEVEENKRNILEKKLQATLTNLCNIKSRRKAVNKLLKRINNHRESLIAFAFHPTAEYHNNKAERQIRPSVIFRKMSFGNRTEKGAENHAVMTTINQTCKLRNIPADKFLMKLTTAPPEKISSVISEYLI